MLETFRQENNIATLREYFADMFLKFVSFYFKVWLFYGKIHAEFTILVKF